MISPGFLPCASRTAATATERWAAWLKMRSMSGLVRSWSWAMLRGVGRLPLHRRLGDDGDLRVGRHLLVEALLDVEGVGVAGVAEDLQHLALGGAVLLGEEADRLVAGDVAHRDGAGDRGEVGGRRGDLPVEDHHRDAGGAQLLDAGLDGVEVDGGEDDGLGAEVQHVVDLVELQVAAVLGVERGHLVADVAHELGDGVDRAGLELVDERGDEVVDRALGLGEGAGARGELTARRVAMAPRRKRRFMLVLPVVWLADALDPPGDEVDDLVRGGGVGARGRRRRRRGG